MKTMNMIKNTKREEVDNMIQVKIEIGDSAYIIEGKVNTALSGILLDKYIVDIKYAVTVIKEETAYVNKTVISKYQHSAMIIYDSAPPAKEVT